MEYPQYTAAIDKKALLITNTFKIIVLGGLFYLGLIFNLNLLDTSDSISLKIKLYSLIAIILLLVTELIINIRKEKLLLFQDRLKAGKKEVVYKTIAKMKIKITISDKLFGTGTLLLNDIKVKYVKNPEYVIAYINKIRNYYGYY